MSSVLILCQHTQEPQKGFFVYRSDQIKQFHNDSLALQRLKNILADSLTEVYNLIFRHVAYFYFTYDQS